MLEVRNQSGPGLMTGGATAFCLPNRHPSPDSARPISYRPRFRDDDGNSLSLSACLPRQSVKKLQATITSTYEPDEPSYAFRPLSFGFTDRFLLAVVFFSHLDSASISFPHSQAYGFLSARSLASCCWQSIPPHRRQRKPVLTRLHAAPDWADPHVLLCAE